MIKKRGINTVPYRPSDRQPGPAAYGALIALWLATPLAAAETPAQEETPRPTETIVWIEVDEDHPFPALFSHREGNENAVLLFHDITSFADDPTLTRPLHQGFPSHGWDTLVPRLPVPPQLAKPDHFQQLLTVQSQRGLAAVSFLRQKGYRNIVFIGHGFGSFVAIMMLSHPSDITDSVDALVSLNTDWYGYPKGRRLLLRTIPELSVPILDIYSGNSHANTVHNASNRDFVLKKLAGKDTLTRQIQIPHRPHSLKGSAAILLRAIDRWLRYVFPDEEEE